MMNEDQKDNYIILLEELMKEVLKNGRNMKIMKKIDAIYNYIDNLDLECNRED